MNQFVTRTKPQNSKLGFPQKRPSSINAQNGNLNNENISISVNGRQEQLEEKKDEPSAVQKLQNAIRENDAQFTFGLLSKNRPFDNAMNKAMTKIEFASSYSDPSSEFMLISVDESVVDAFKEGQSLTIRGETTDDAVLCTDDATFPMKIIESATTVLLLHNCLDAPLSPTLPNFGVETVDGKCYSTGELCPSVEFLNVGRLKDMLREEELRWDWKNREEDEKMKGYRLRDLLESVQMSVGEVKTALADLPVVKFPSGRYRYLSHKYRGEMLGLIVELFDEESSEELNLESISYKALRTHLPENVPDEVIEWFLKSRCEKTEDNNEQYRLPEVTLIRDLSVVILYGTQKMPLRQFYDLLGKILPFGVKVDDAVFEGIADISDAPFGKIITYLAPEDLPDTVKERMLYLFAYRKLWTMEQLRPYFKDMYKSKVAFDKYIVQNCDYSLSESSEMLYCGVR